MLTGGQMPEQGVPEQQSVKIVAAKTTVDGNASAGVIGVAVKQQPKSPEPVVNKVMRPNISEVNKMASGQGTLTLIAQHLTSFQAHRPLPRHHHRCTVSHSSSHLPRNSNSTRCTPSLLREATNLSQSSLFLSSLK